ncbi:hypothetical protein [Streptosporangium sp. NPDC023615]|uniref:hypothetical protein n=1 Tax=Streptosporangium sp. NPDC023615 TaxID=3154794 RepID=UPI0034477895
MIALTLALAVASILLCVFNLVLTAGVIRRLREHAEQLSSLAGVPRLDTMQPANGRIGFFEAVTTKGVAICRSDLKGHMLVGAFAEGCPMCEKALPEFVQYAKEFPGGRDQVMTVLLGDSSRLEKESAQLEPVAQVILEERSGTMSAALGIQGYPAIGVLNADIGVILVAGTGVEHVQRFTSTH